MATMEPVEAAPAVSEAVPTTYDEDFPAHVRTYNNFLNFMRSAIGLFAFVLAALYFFLEGHNPIAGTVLLVIGVGVFLFGLFHNAAMNRDFGRTLET